MYNLQNDIYVASTTLDAGDYQYYFDVFDSTEDILELQHCQDYMCQKKHQQVADSRMRTGYHIMR
jgi:hypothetical protein